MSQGNARESNAMPGTVLKGQLSSIEETLSASIGGNTKSTSQDLARKLASQSRSILLQKINFVSAVHESNSHWNDVAEKYSRKHQDMNTNNQKNVAFNGIHKKAHKDNDGLPLAKMTLYDANKLQLEWRQGARKGGGLQNTHNTCFMNSVLQALTYTPAYNNYLHSKDHSSKCENRGMCMICIMEEHVRCVTTRNVWTPWSIIKNLRFIAKHFSHGRQEDAHEFLRYFIEAMTKSALLQHSKLDVYSKNTTALHQIFGGYLRSQVKCINCDHKSNTFDPMLDIALDIKDVNNLHQALDSFTKPESLHGENCYSCERCKKKVKAIKRFSIHQAPNILTIQLKRFDMAKLHSKVNKPINFPPNLNIRSYMSNKQGQPVKYSLYAVLVHSGACASFGHYYTYAKVPNGQWYLFNDSHVSASSIESVLRQQAYILFYCKHVQSTENNGTQHSPLIGPVKKPMVGNNLPYSLHNGAIGKRNGDIMGTPIPRKIPPSATAPKPPTPVPTSPIKGPTPVPQTLHVNKVNSVHQPTKIAGDKERQKISFGIKPKSGKSESVAATPGVPLVMKIKHGKVVSNTASPPDTSTNTIFSPGSATKGASGEVRRRLVPYNVDNTSSSDNEVEAINGSQANKSPVKNGHSNGVNGSKDSNGKLTNGTNGHAEPKLVKPKPMFTNNQTKKDVCAKSKESPIKAKDLGRFEPILDERLKATTEVPGSYAPLDRLQNNGFKTPPFRTLDRKELTLNLSSPEPGKLNSTSKWAIIEQEQKSPSLASSSSSINSTSDWKIRDDSPKKANKTPQNGSLNATVGSPLAWTVTPVPMAIVKNIHCNQDVPSDTAASGDSHGAHVIENVANQNCKESNQLHPQKLFAEQGPSAHSNQVLFGPHNKPDSNGHSSAAGDVNGSHSVRSSLNTTPDSHLSADTSVNSSSSKKKKKRDKRDESGSSVHECSETDHRGERKKRKKKKKHKRREYEPGELSDSPEPRKRGHEVDEHAPSKKQKQDYEWVERTKETIQRESKPVNQAPGTQWDQPNKQATSSQSWDGVRSDKSDVLSHLQQSSLQGYGPQVNSWDGGMSTLDKEFATEKKNLKRGWADDYEEQLDMGKVKKVKGPREDSHGPDNLFQNFQNQLNQDKQTNVKESNMDHQDSMRGDDQYGNRYDGNYNHHGNHNFWGNQNFRGNQNNYRPNQHGRYGDNRQNNFPDNRQFYGDASNRDGSGNYQNRNHHYQSQNRGGQRGGGYNNGGRGNRGHRGGQNNRGNRPYNNRGHDRQPYRRY